MKKKNTTIKTYKGFDKDMKCRGFQYEVGKTYETKDKPVRCTSHGFHSCENPFDVWDYYNVSDSRFAECEVSGNIDKDSSDSKIASSKIEIKLELNLKSMIEAGIKFLFSKTIFKYKDTKLNNNRDYAQIGSSGYYAKIGSEGYSAKIGSSGDYAQIGSEGEKSVVSAIGHNSKVKAKKDSWITLAEYDNQGIIKCVKSAKIDGKKLKADTWYKLKNGKFVKTK